METSPVPSPAAATEPRGWHLSLWRSWVRVGVRRKRWPCNGSACPQLAPVVRRGRTDPRSAAGAHGARVRGETEWLRTGRLPAASRLGTSPAPVHGGTGSASPLLMAICLSVTGLGAGP